jgi:hypothetical protein
VIRKQFERRQCFQEFTANHTALWFTANCRENLLKVSDSKFVSLLKEPERFKAKQCRTLFGSHFIKEMVREATNDQKLSNIGFRSNGGPII